jgi:hypothetical protein
LAGEEKWDELLQSFSELAEHNMERYKMMCANTELTEKLPSQIRKNLSIMKQRRTS